MPTPPPPSAPADPPNETTVAGRPPDGGEGTDDRDGDGQRDGASTGRPTRREFAARAVTALAALSTLGASGLGACAHPGVASSPPSPLPAPAEPLGAPRTVAGGDLTDALCAAVDARYGARLEADERARVRDAIGRTARLSDALRQHRVPNGADPFSSFRHPAAGRGGGTGDGRDA